jgi:hypothetical protein
MAESTKNKPKPVEIEINSKPFTAPDHKMTAREIIVLSGDDPAAHYLKEIKGKDQISYKDKPDEEITLNKNSRFITVYTGDAQVS